MKGPNVTLTDVFYWGGFIAGTGISHTVLLNMGLTNRIVLLLISICCGLALGTLLEMIHKGGSMPPPPPE